MSKVPTATRRLRTAAVMAALAVTVAACGGGTGAPDGEPQLEGDADALGGAAAVEEMTGLYAAAREAGEDTVVVYGPGVEDLEPVYEQFAERFPGIEVRGEYLAGPELDHKLEAEVASNQHVADVIDTGNTAVARHVELDRYLPFTPVTAQGLDPSFQDEGGTTHSAMASTFGIVYNTDQVSAEAAPTSWEDLLDPRWRGKIVMQDPTSFGGAFGALSKLLNDDRYDEQFVKDLHAQNPHLVAATPATGEAVAVGEFPLAAFYPYSFYVRDADRGAPVAFVFPVEGGNHLNPHYLGVVDGAPHPEAAKLLVAWLFSPEGQQAIADVGYYPTVPDGAAPGDYPPVNELDLLKAFTLPEVNTVAAEHLELVQAVFK